MIDNVSKELPFELRLQTNKGAILLAVVEFTLLEVKNINRLTR